MYAPVQKRSVQDMLPNAAIVAMTACAIGSNRGYDEIVPHYIDVVNEKRLYASWGQGFTPYVVAVISLETSPAHLSLGKPTGVHVSNHGILSRNATCNENTGMIAARKAINDIHVEMGEAGFEELYVDQVTSDIIFVTRHNPATREVCGTHSHGLSCMPLPGAPVPLFPPIAVCWPHASH